MSPALAVADSLSNSGDSVFYVGSKLGPEGNLARENNLRYYGISTGKLRRYFSWQNFIDPFRVLWGFVQSLRIIWHEKPNVIFCAGGYVALPVGLAGWILRKPLVLNEADSHFGLTTKILSKFAKKICLAFPDDQHVFPDGKAQLTGLPLRPKLLQGDKNRALKKTGLSGKKPIVLVLGGSQGAQFINDLIAEILPEITEFCDVIHQTGKGKKSLSNSKNYFACEFVNQEDMADYYAVAIGSICRAGANTLFELAGNGLPCLIIPLPTAAGDHQTKNGNYFVQSGGAVMARQDMINPDRLVAGLREYINDTKRLEKMSEAMRKFAQNGTENVVKIIRNCYENRN